MNEEKRNNYIKAIKILLQTVHILTEKLMPKNDLYPELPLYAIEEIESKFNEIIKLL